MFHAESNPNPNAMTLNHANKDRHYFISQSDITHSNMTEKWFSRFFVFFKRNKERFLDTVFASVYQFESKLTRAFQTSFHWKINKKKQKQIHQSKSNNKNTYLVSIHFFRYIYILSMGFNLISRFFYNSIPVQLASG